MTGSWASLLVSFGEDLSKAMVLRQALPLYGCFRHQLRIPLTCSGVAGAEEPVVPFARDQAPERAFAAVVSLQALHVGIMSFEPAKILDPVSQGFALLKMPGSVLISLGPVPLQGTVNQGPAKNGGRKRMFRLQLRRRRRKDLVEVTIAFVGTGKHRVRSLGQRRPDPQKTQGMVHNRWQVVFVNPC
jgi:hypothetical protein